MRVQDNGQVSSNANEMARIRSEKAINKIVYDLESWKFVPIDLRNRFFKKIVLNSFDWKEKKFGNQIIRFEEPILREGRYIFDGFSRSGCQKIIVDKISYCLTKSIIRI